MEWCVYIVRCADQSLYTGVSNNLLRRCRQHNGELTGGARYTRVRRPVVLVWSEGHLDRSSAQKAEYRVKQLSREEKERLIRTV